MLQSSMISVPIRHTQAFATLDVSAGVGVFDNGIVPGGFSDNDIVPTGYYDGRHGARIRKPQFFSRRQSDCATGPKNFEIEEGMNANTSGRKAGR